MIDTLMLLLIGDGDPLGVDTFATHRLPIDKAPEAYEIFQKADNAFKILLNRDGAWEDAVSPAQPQGCQYKPVALSAPGVTP